jgi:shikimate 5-dehydrogenase
VKAKVIEQLGLDRAETPPLFQQKPTKIIRIVEIQAVRIGSLTTSDFVGSSPDVFDKQSLVYHLGIIYNLDANSLGDNALVTKINFIYEGEQHMNHTNASLPYEGLLTPARLPVGNPQSLADFASYDLTPIDHDYAGQFARKANHVFQQLQLPIGFVMMVGDSTNVAEIYQAFRQDPKYLGGGSGSGFKNKAPAVLDELDELAEQIGAINVVAKIEGRLRGYNTDGIGFVRGLEELLAEKRDISSLSGLNILIIGAGGTADAIAFTLASKGAQLTILNRTAEKAEKLAQRICAAYGNIAFGGSEDLLPEKLPAAYVVINASTKSAEGVFKDFIAFAEAKAENLALNISQSVEHAKLLSRDAVVCDINLRADLSPTLRLAEEHGHLTQDGGPMNFYQAVEALWIIHHKTFEENGVTKAQVATLIKEVS